MSSRKLFLPFLLVLAFIVRVILSIQHIDLIYPDEHFQVLEPANLIVNGIGFKTWEWYHGTRSWFVPALYMPVLYLLKMVGISSGPTPIIISKIFTSVIFLIMSYKFYKLLEHFEIDSWIKKLTLILFLTLPNMIVWSCTTFSDTWSMMILWILMPLIIHTITIGNKSKQWLMVGALLGITFLTRIQMILWPIGLLLTIFIWGNSNQKRNSIHLIIGYTIAILAQGILDLITWGHFFHSAIKNFKMNLFEGVANLNGTQAWYFYFIELIKNFNLFFAIILLISIFIIIVNYKKMNFKFKLILFPSFIFLFAHTLIGHKELRFILCLFPTLFLLFAMGLQYIFKYLQFLNKLKLSWLYVFIFVFTPYSLSTTYSEKYYSNSDLSNIFNQIYNDNKNPTLNNECIFILENYWHWGRGQMILGTDTKFINIKIKELESQNLTECRYAIIMSWTENKFNEVTLGKWLKLYSDHWGHILYKKY